MEIGLGSLMIIAVAQLIVYSTRVYASLLRKFIILLFACLRTFLDYLGRSLHQAGFALSALFFYLGFVWCL